MEKKNLNDEFEFIKQNAEMMRVPYIVQLATCYLYGLKGAKRDFKKAFEYFSLASHLGDEGAKVSIGYMYVKGQGVDKVKLNFSWFD